MTKNNKMKISVAMAVYNGAEYIEEQIYSITPQLGAFDELIISYDKSTDNTLEILNKLSKKDNRLKIYPNPYKTGVAKNFQNAIEHCNGDIIFYSDQDDVWMSDKISIVMKEFDELKVAAVVHDAHLTDDKLNIIKKSTFKLRGGVRTTFWGNFVRLSYIGCCMAFRAAYKDVIIPIPTIYRSHDWWTGSILSCGPTKIKTIEKQLIYHRYHNSNATPTTRPSLLYQLQVRWIILKNVILRYNRKRKIDKSLNIK